MDTRVTQGGGQGRTGGRARRWVGLAVVAVLAAVGMAPAAASPPARNIVLLVDASTSMDDIMPTVRAALDGLVDLLQPGDQCQLYAFGDQVRRVATADMSVDADVAALRASIATLQPTDRHTDITSALDRGVRALRRRALDAPDQLPMLVLLTDGRHNPASADDSPGWEDIPNIFDDFRPGNEWFMHYLVLKPDASDAQAEAFVEAVQGVYTLLQDLATLPASLATFPSPLAAQITDASGLVSVRPASDAGFVPATVGGAVAAGDLVETWADARAVLTVGDRLRVGLGLAAQVELRTATWDPMRGAGEIVLHVRQGTVELLSLPAPGTWVIHIETPSGTVVLDGTRLRIAVDPISREADIAVRAGAVQVRPVGADAGVRCRGEEAVRLRDDNTVTTPVPMPEAVTEFSRAWDDVLDGEQTLAAARHRFVFAAWSTVAVRLGPLHAAGQWREQRLLHLAGLNVAEMAAAHVAVQGAMPEGLTLTAHLDRLAAVGPHTLVLVAQAAPDFVPDPGITYTADVVLTFADTEVTARFPVALWARAEAAAVPDPVPGRTAGTGGWGVIGAFAAIAVLALVFVYRGGDPLRFVRRTSTDPGRLLVVGNPAADAMDSDFVRLDQWSDRRADKPISVGSNTYCDIVLPHASVADHHCNLRLVRAHGTWSVAVEPVKGTVWVADQTVEGKTAHLADRTQLRVGDFVLQYEDSGAKPQVLVHLATGQTVRGALHSWDMHAPTFTLAPDDPDVKLPGGPIPDIPFADVQDVAMLSMQGKRRRRRRKNLRRVEVEFPTGRSVRGDLWADYHPDAALFSLFPDDQPDVDYLVVVRANTSRIDRDGGLESAGDSFAG